MSRRLDIENFTAEKLAWHQLISATPGLSLPAKAVAGLLLHDLNPLQGGAWRGQDSMSELLGVSERQLRRLLSELQKAGFLDIEIQKGRGRTNRYFATVPTGIELFRLKSSETADKAPDHVPEKRTPASSYPVKNRTPMTKKPDMDVRQYLYEPIKNSTRVRSANDKPDSQRNMFRNAKARDIIVRVMGEPAATSYVDPARWDENSQTIVCATSVAAVRLQELVGTTLSREGISISHVLAVKDLAAA